MKTYERMSTNQLLNVFIITEPLFNTFSERFVVESVDNQKLFALVSDRSERELKVTQSL